jgi:tetratricopeptide (TPR) repeat protein/CHAT domain-containing protein
MVVSPAGAQSPAADSPQQWQLLSGQGKKAYEAGDYSKGIALAEKALALARRAFGDRDPRILKSLNDLAVLYKAQGRYGEAEALYQEALQRSLVLGARHPETLTSLNNLADLYEAQGRYSEAEPLFQQALQTRRELLGPRHSATLTTLNNLAGLYVSQDRYSEAEPLYREALQARREVLGVRHPDTIGNINDLAYLYEAQGRYGEAEPMYREALQASREVLGSRHPTTLGILSNLAAHYEDQGHYTEAEPLFLEALQASREVLGSRHPQTLGTLGNLAFVYQAQGRYGEAEPLYREALKANREVLGSRHLQTLKALSNLAAHYVAQGRYSEAEPLFQEALQTSREVLGPRHSSTLVKMDNLAAVYSAQARYSEAEPLYREALQTSREVLGPRHPDTLISLGNVAAVYKNQGRYGEAEPMFQEALRAKREVLGPRHPGTLISLASLAGLYEVQGRYGEAEPLYRDALQARREVLGPGHPDTLTTELDMTGLLVNSGRSDEALRVLQHMEPHLLGWIGQELYSTEAGAVRRLVSSQATFQNFVLTLATTQTGGDARRLAGTVMLRFKLLQGEEEAYLARLTRRSQDPRVRALADEVGKLRSTLAGAARGAPGTFNKTLQALEAQQLALGEVSRDYKDHLRVLTANLDDLRAVLPAGAVLVEFRQFQPVDFRATKWGEPRFAALLLAGFDEPVVADLGPVSEMGQPTIELTDAAAAALYQKLFARFEDKLAAATTVYIAPDGILDLVPFARLKLADGRYWGERQQLRLLQTGRDLLRPDPDKPARGLLALGGIDFGAAAKTKKGRLESVVLATSGSGRKNALTRAAGTLHDGFKVLPASSDEVVQIKEWYHRLRKNEPADVRLGADASKARLMALKSPPRVLHLATHGFYLPNEVREPMLLSGVALAGANRELEGKGADGILFALEAQGLNLDGSELVVLSACETALGSLDYSEGIYGLVRALRTAGARNVLVTLWPLNDGEARDFMIRFYKTWLNQTRSDPARALRDIQLSYLKDDKLHDPRIWAPYILIE